MQELRKIWAFGVPYLRPYMFRFVAGVGLGILFGMSNGMFVISVDTLFSRLSQPTPPALTQQASPAPHATGWAGLQAKVSEWWKENAGPVADTFLPRIGHPMTWLQAVGAFSLLPLVMLVRCTASYLSTYCLTWVSARVNRDMQVAALKKAQELSLAYFLKRPAADIYNCISSDTRVIYDSMTNGFIDTIREPFAILSVFLAIVWIDWKLTLISLLLLPLVVGPVVIGGRRVRWLMKNSITAGIQQIGYLLEALQSVRIVKAYGMENRQMAKFRDLASQMAHMSVKLAQTRNLLNPLIEVLSMFGVGLLIVVVFATRTEASSLVSFLTALMLVPLSIKRIANLHLTLAAASISIGRLESFYAEQPSVPEPARPRPLNMFREGLRVENLSFSYGHHPVLQDISLQIPRGKKIGLAGESGSGKSTLINLLMRFYDPTHGRILLDGHDLREYASTDLFRQMALVSQDVVLFDTTAAENIGFGREGATRGEIETAARQAQAHDFIRNMPQGFESPIGERGQLLSGGQKARMAIARAFVRNAPILILDEPTAALDSRAESEIQASIDSLEEGRTVICIAHRLSTLANMDEIVVLDHGRIVERGPFEDLLRSKGHFAKMAEQQRLTASD
ncbi:MAG: ABC transporter ATP-binding protein [Verrucomicrobia bacterium]|nr:ABC transporter ATP-binding protein [Verrucomicrobiota bacterium]